jgi:hypothetical protein
MPSRERLKGLNPAPVQAHLPLCGIFCEIITFDTNARNGHGEREGESAISPRAKLVHGAPPEGTPRVLGNYGQVILTSVHVRITGRVTTAPGRHAG